MAKTIHRHEYRQLIDQLRERRYELGLSQRDTAEALGWSQQKLSYAESGARRIDVIEYIQWCRGLRLSPEQAFALAQRYARAAARKRRVPAKRSARVAVR